MRFSAVAAVFVSALLGVAIRSADACTTFWSHTADGAVVGKSFDWGTSAGWIVANERGRVRTKLVAGGPAEVASWTSRFASLSFTTVGPGFPISGMNEAGLAIESLVDLSARPTTLADPARLTGLELVQFGLDHHESAAEFASFAERAGVSQLGVALHFFACDRRGECVVVEPRADGTHVTRGTELRVRALANRSWSDDWSSLEPSTWQRLSNLFRSSSASEVHFATVARLLRADRPHDTSDAFGALASVETPGLTAWQIVWNLDKGEVRWREHGSERISTLRLADEDATCRGPSRVRPIGSPSGAPAFAPWSASDAARAQAAIVSQLPLRGPQAQRLAASVALMTLKSECAPTK